MDEAGTKYETREVLAGAYTGRSGQRRKPKTMLTHTVKVVGGEDVEVLCSGRVKLENMADGYIGERQERPTCPVCKVRDPRFKSVKP